MKKIRSTVALAALLIGAANFAIAQNAPGAPQPGALTFVDSDIRLVIDYPPVAAKAFASTPVRQLKKGSVLPATGVIGPLGMTQMWSRSQHEFSIGPRTAKYPVIGSVRCSNFPNTGSFTRVIASTTVLKVNLKAGEVLHSGDYRIEARRAIQSGEAIPTLRIVTGGKDYFLSIEETPSNHKDASTQPALAIVNELAPPGDFDIVMEAWRKSNESIRTGVLNGHEE